MQKIGIKIIGLNEVMSKEIAKILQTFIIKGNYSIPFIIYQMQNEKIIELDINKDEEINSFINSMEEFDKKGISYCLYGLIDDKWEQVELDSFDLERIPEWQFIILRLVIVGYFIISFFKIFTIYDWYTITYELNGIISAIGAIVTAFIPIVSSLFSYWSATELWHWNSYFVLFIYFLYYLPIIIFIIYVIFFKLFYKDR